MGEGDDEVLRVGVVGVLRYVEREGDVGRAPRSGVVSADGAAAAAGGGGLRAVGGAVGLVAAEVGDREVDVQVWEGGEDLVGGGWLEDGAAVGVGALLGIGCCEGEEGGEEGDGGGEGEVHFGELEGARDGGFCVAGRCPTSKVAFQY